MDELFHVEQTRRYCDGQWDHWDPKITTPPGLYLFHVAYARLMGIILKTVMGIGDDELCKDLVFMRGFNAVMYGLLVAAVAQLVQLEFKSVETYANGVKRVTSSVDAANKRSSYSWDTLLQTIRISTFPLVFFFSLLYYTDVGSTMLILWAYLLCRKGQTALSASCCALAVLFRQTSIVWTVWIMAQQILKDFSRECKTRRQQERDSFISNAVDFVKYGLQLRNVVHIIQRYVAFVIVGMGFVVFALINGGIAVGDRDNHVITWNVPQLFFFAVFACVFAPGVHIVHLASKRTFNAMRRSITNTRILLSVVLFTALIAVLSYRHSVVHIFLLSDNRHFTFYIWRRLFRIHEPDHTRLFHALYSPVFLAAMIMCAYTLKRSGKGSLWIALFALCMALNIVPMPLVEFRYFVIPFILMQINNVASNHASRSATILDIVFNIVINAATIYLFLFRTFIYGEPGSLEEIGRFMW